ncbi:MAG: arginine repressor [Bacteroidaceae bacterium]|nr:arginine repressor [Bacteroidaceae bacterium]
MKKKTNRLDTIKMLISSREICSQEELLELLNREGMGVTQATLSRDLKQLKVAKASSMTGKYVYVLPNSTVYRRLPEKDSPVHEMMKYTGFISINFSGNIAVIRTRPGYASSLAYDIDNQDLNEIVGTIAGDDTIMLVIRENVTHEQVRQALYPIIHNQY